MDWSKAKTILIIAFIIVNIVVVYVVISQKPTEDPTLTDEFVGNVKKLLSEKNISVESDIPKIIPSLKSLIVEFEKANLDDLNNRYFNGNGVMEYDEELQETVMGDKSILVINERLIIYEDNGEDVLYENIDKDKAIEISQDFMKKGKFDTSDMKLTYFKEEQGVFYLEYSKVYDGVIIERAYTNFQIDNRGVKRFERLWLDPKELGEYDIYISTAPKSLLNLLGMQEVYGKTITDISLCYYFDPEKHEYSQGFGETKQGKAVPAWRIQFNDGYKVFIDEY